MARGRIVTCAVALACLGHVSAFSSPDAQRHRVKSRSLDKSAQVVIFSAPARAPTNETTAAAAEDDDDDDDECEIDLETMLPKNPDCLS
ncbi:hypothetical protein M885DRAFT_612010 [Pelagophyceae sp. CCMP2097]|nr:hypothetical protein M885DRAFT_612010 [Pelagophyceae sp. CCMP2097]